MEDLRRLLRYASRSSPFFGGKLAGMAVDAIGESAAFAAVVPLTRLEELVTEKQQGGDPYSGRRSRRPRPWISLQLEGDVGSLLYLALDGPDLQTYADVLRGCWSLLGLGQGDRVAIFDYGSSPLSYLASSLYIPYLTRGAADSLGCIPVCNDGLPEMSGRLMDILRYAHPRALFIRSDCVHPFTEEARRLELEVGHYLGFVVVAGNEQVFPEESRRELEASLGVPVYRVLRVDLAMFLAQECSECRCFHYPSHLYQVEVVDEYEQKPLAAGEPGMLVVTNLFARTTPAIRYLSDVRASLEPGACLRGPDDGRFRA